MDLTKTPGIDMDSWYHRIRILVETWTHGIDMDSLFPYSCYLYLCISENCISHGIEMEAWI